jgi:hypothetical protein
MPGRRPLLRWPCTRRAACSGQRPAPFRCPPGQTELDHPRRDRVLGDLPARFAQVMGDPRAAVGAARGSEQSTDLLVQLLAPLITCAGPTVDPLVEPGLRDPPRPVRSRVPNAETGPLGRDELRHDRWFIESFTHRSTERLSTSRSISNSGLSLAQRARSARNRANCSRSDSLNVAADGHALRRGGPACGRRGDHLGPRALTARFAETGEARTTSTYLGDFRCRRTRSRAGCPDG